MAVLSKYVSVKKRYSRSVNLERDFGIPDSLTGYVPTSRALDSTGRFLRAFGRKNSVRSWTLTGSYGSGKSAFANFLAALCSPHDDEIFKRSIRILEQTKKTDTIQKQIKNSFPKAGLIRAVATAQREPVSRTIIKALFNGATLYWQNKKGRRPEVLHTLEALYLKTQKDVAIDNHQLLGVIQSLAQASKSGILLIIDELGKSLEFSAQNQSIDDLYLLQQIAELPENKDGFHVFVFGLLHQAFIDYAHGLASAQRNEWAKIQGRFEDIPFVESPDLMMKLIGNAIDNKSKDKKFRSSIEGWAKNWSPVFVKDENFSSFSQVDISSIYPLHPLSAFALPILCTKYAQNDRTLFTFLSSSEPDSLSTFLSQAPLNHENPKSFKLHRLYDYFVGSAGMSIAARPQSQKWVEIQSRIHDASHLDHDLVLVLKTIGLLNLISTTGSLKASLDTVVYAMSNNPHDKNEHDRWKKLIKDLLAKGFLTRRKQIDELRIWEGSDFDIEKELSEQADVLNLSVADLLNTYSPLKPLVIQRHSYETGTLRYFERRYYDDVESFKSMECQSKDSDGLISFWVGNESDIKKLEEIPQLTKDGKPVLILAASERKALKIACREYASLLKIRKRSSQLQSDGVARREISERILFSQRILDASISRSFDMASGNVNAYLHDEKVNFKSWGEFQIFLSHRCDEVYPSSPHLWNELINRRELSSQGATARNKLIAAMIDKVGQPKVGISGTGPEYSMFESVLKQAGIYREVDNEWVFSKPFSTEQGIYHVWMAIEEFCKSAKEDRKNIGELYALLEDPPYGAKKGIIPVLLLSVLLYHNEYISIYIDGSFIPVLGPEHFELLVKKPDRFSVKYFELSGVKAEIFTELGQILSAGKAKKCKRRLKIATVGGAI